ncbi:HlyU family transcriptional regulator [Spiribacter salinus]|uniref:HlyU family transcriptional regulator n=1 Tax=Spiribacter salinus TaxID=1335746 RepID=UPI001C94B6C7|nr:HlyU family transcriptional regulator [Spiribacter salinus]
MVIRFLRSMLGANGHDNPPGVAAESEHHGYLITAMPTEESGGWRVSGTISGDIDGETRTVTFVRADIYGSQSVAAEMTLLKARRLIDEQGHRLFNGGH